MPENARSAIMEAEGREPKALGQTFEISARHPFGTAPFGWGISANGIYGLNVPEDPAIDSFMMFHRDTGLLTIDISGANGWGLYCEMSLHPAYNSDLFRWHAISGPGSDLNGAMTFDPATLIHFFVVPPITEVPPNTAVIELSADPGNANGDWEFRKLMLTPFQV